VVTLESIDASSMMTGRRVPPDSAVAWRQFSTGPYGSKGAEIIGLSRGLYVEVYTWRTDGAETSPADLDILVNLFNEQVSKLEAA